MASVLFFLILTCSPVMAEENQAEQDEWTVMFYFCGSDLESKYGYATQNLADISAVHYPDSWLPLMAKYYDLDPESMEITVPGKVNVLLETGGCQRWHTMDEEKSLDMDIKTDALQRWRYNVYPDAAGPNGERNGYELMETLPLKSMAAPETLTDFIRWGVSTCPAKKYALVLWDHGGGAMTGLFIDELFDYDIMYLYELREALLDSGVQFEALIIDACLMANIETAWSVKDSARWMVASEELVPGKGTAVHDWLQALYAYPECDGEWLGRCVCDMTGIQYANDSEKMSKTLLTWSVIDLSKIDRLVKTCEAYLKKMCEALDHYPIEASVYNSFIFEAEMYGDGQQNMRDLGTVIYNPSTMTTVDLRVRNDLMKALSDAVVYITRGPGRASGRGLSFCYPADFSEDELDIYAKNCPMPLYLAYIDAITEWTAPDWVYEKTSRLPSIDDIKELQIIPLKKMTKSGMPGVALKDMLYNIKNIFYRLYQLDETTGHVVYLGRTVCGIGVEDKNVVWRASDPMHWPAIDDDLCCIDMIQENGVMRLYNIPVQINSKNAILRCGRTIFFSEDGEKRYSEYEVYGVWENYDENNTLMNRSVEPLALISGREYKLMYPLDGDEKGVFDYSEEKTMYRALDVREIPLPAGVYYLEYEVQDTFMRSRLLDRIEIHWDGQNMTFPDGFVWEGEVK